MSFVISSRQYLAPNETRAQYEPLIFEWEGFDMERIDVAFGHPLYTTVADIFYMKSLVEERCMLPIVPDGCMAMVLCGNEEKAEGYMCGAIDEIKKLPIEPDKYYIFVRFHPGTGYSLVKNDPYANRITNKALPLREYVAGGDQILAILGRETQLVERIRLISKVIRVGLHDEPNKYLIKYCAERIFEAL